MARERKADMSGKVIQWALVKEQGQVNCQLVAKEWASKGQAPGRLEWGRVWVEVNWAVKREWGKQPESDIQLDSEKCNSRHLVKQSPNEA